MSTGPGTDGHYVPMKEPLSTAKALPGRFLHGRASPGPLSPTGTAISTGLLQLDSGWEEASFRSVPHAMIATTKTAK
jgi:hypothetical protein